MIKKELSKVHLHLRIVTIRILEILMSQPILMIWQRAHKQIKMKATQYNKIGFITTEPQEL